MNHYYENLWNTNHLFPKNSSPTDKYLEYYLKHLYNINYSSLKTKLPYTRKSSSETAIRHLREAYTQGNLTLVLGAGISNNYGLPNWNELLQRLLIKTIENTPEQSIVLSKLFTILFNPSPLIAGRYLQDSLVDKKDLHKFEKEVRNALYESFNPNFESKIMDEIVKLCVAPGNSPNLDGIITYNYDDILENKLTEKNIDIPFQSIYGQGINPENKTLPIYHVHGYLPIEGKINEQNSITLGEFVYHEQYNKLYSWNNIVQINKFRDKTCLFIGISLNDPNIRRLLDIANEQKKSSKFHYVLRKKIDQKWMKSKLEKLLNDEELEAGPKENIDIDETVNFLIEMKQRYDEKDSESLGVKTVWIDDYEEDISKILNKIRIQEN